MDPRVADLMAQVKDAPNEYQARLLTNQIWEIWADAPDDEAQRLLDDGMSRRASFDLDGARKAFDALIAYCPDYAEGYNQRAFVAFIQKDYEAALDDLELVLNRVPNHFAALAGKGLSYYGLGQIDDAVETLKAALELNPWLPERHILEQIKGTDL